MKPADIWNRIYGDFLMPSRLDLFRDLLVTARQAGYRPISVEAFWELHRDRAPDPSRRYLILRHDIDTDPGTAAAFWAIERELGVEASYYFRLATVDLDLMRDIGRGGGHASYHYEDLAALVKQHHLRGRDAILASFGDAQAMFRRHLVGLREATGLPMTTVASHGDFINRKIRVPNWAILADRGFRREVGVDLETYDEAFMQHVSSRHADTGHPAYWAPDDPATAIRQGFPVVYVLTHPRNWRADPVVNLRDNLGRLREGFRYGLPALAPRWEADGRRPAGAGRPDRAGSQPIVDPRTTTAKPSASPPVDGEARRAAPPPTSSRPVLAVRIPWTYPAERRYVVDVVLSNWLGLTTEIDETDGSETTLRLVGDPGDRTLTLPDGLFATRPRDWLTEASMPTSPLTMVTIDGPAHDPVRPDDGGSPRRVPVLYGAPAEDGKAWRETAEGLTLTVDVLGSVFFLLTRYEEVVRRIRDEHERFPAYASVGAIEHFLERPIADELVDVLWAAIRTLWPDLRRRETSYRLRLTHDVDQPWAALDQPMELVAQSLGADVFDRRDLALAARRAWSFVASRVGRLSHDPFDTFDLLMSTSERLGLRSVFFFLASRTRGGFNGRYALTDRPIARLLTRIHERGHEIGLHASYDSYCSPEMTLDEIQRLRLACAGLGIEQEAWGVRQHFLRFENPQTWRNHALAGIAYDSSLSFADHVGFRAGTCREFPVFDLLARHPLPVRERPLIIMDATLLGYMGLGLDEAAARARSVADECRRHGGETTVCYHNSSLPGARQRAHYRDLARDLAIGDPAASRSLVAPLSSSRAAPVDR